MRLLLFFFACASLLANALGLLDHLSSSDGTIDYAYSYDLSGHLLQAQGTERRYDNHGRLVYEKLETGFEFNYSYDDLDRVTEVRFLDNTLTYTYSPTTLVKASRYTNDVLLYTFSQVSDWHKKPLRSSINNLSTLYSWDTLGQIEHIAAPHFDQTFVYDAVGNLTQTAVCDPMGCYTAEFIYDDLDQLLQETGPHPSRYSYDSLYNRRLKDGLSYTVDTLNQVTQGENSYTYDPVGRRLSEGETHYHYDALGRLLSLSDEVRYTYDAFGRRLSKHSAAGQLHYLYQFDTEIGTYDKEPKEFRATLGKHNPFAIELQNEIYLPIRNHRGDICVLLTLRGSPVSTTRYDAFGIPTLHGTPVSPWLFSGQRLEHGLYHYDKREYDPHLGRWLTPDPLGFADGPNVYAYVHNCPLTFIDPYGLFGFHIISDTGLFTLSQSAPFNHFCQGFSRGALDNTSWGLSNYALGNHQPLSWTDSFGYYTGTAASLGAGLFYGNTEAKALYYGAKGLYKSASFIHQKGLPILNGLKNLTSRTLSNTRHILPRPPSQTGSTLAQQVRAAESSMARTGVCASKAEANVAKSAGRNRFAPDPNATGAHSVFRRDPITQRITHYETYRPQTNPFDPKSWETVVRFDNSGRINQSHFNKVLNKHIFEPHVHDPTCLGGIRPAMPWEIP